MYVSCDQATQLSTNEAGCQSSSAVLLRSSLFSVIRQS